MNTATQIRPPRTVREMLAEVIPLGECAPIDGPPILFLLVPWLLLAFMLAGPVACLFALVLVAIVVAAALAALAALLATPYLLVHHLRRHRSPRATIGAPAAQLVATGSPRVAR